MILVNVESWRIEINNIIRIFKYSTMSTSNFNYEYYEYNIKISMNAYKYQKL